MSNFQMYIGTTPTFNLAIDPASVSVPLTDKSVFSEMCITFGVFNEAGTKAKKRYFEKVMKAGQGFVVDDGTDPNDNTKRRFNISFTLTEEESLKLRAGEVAFQVKIKLADAQNTVIMTKPDTFTALASLCVKEMEDHD